jgi:paraquat-inducible protein B
MSYKIYKHRGKDITITFKNVEGLVPNQSKIMFRGAEIGSVNDIELDLTTGYPVVHARIPQYVLSMFGEKSSFWIVRPELGIGSINNLSALSTGDYIAVNPVPGKFCNKFTGLEDIPVEDKYVAALTITLKGKTAGGIETGSPVLYRDLQIGDVGEITLSNDKRYVLIKLYIQSPYETVIRKNSLFGNVSGFHADISIFSGSHIGFDSLRTMVKGGIKVITPNMRCPAAKNHDTFELLSNEQLEELSDR